MGPQRNRDASVSTLPQRLRTAAKAPLLIWLIAAPILLGASVATHEAIHCTLAYAGGAPSCTIDLVPGWCAQRDMTLTGFCLGSATAERAHAPLPIVVEEVVAYTGSAVPVLLFVLLRSHMRMNVPCRICTNAEATA